MLHSSESFAALHAIAVAVGGLHDPPDLARVAGESARESVGADGVGLYLWSEASAVLEPLYVNDPHVAGSFRSMTAGQGAVGQAFQQRQPMLVTDYSDWAHALEWAIEHGVQQVVAVPLVVAEQAIGALGVRFLSARNCTPEYVQVLELVAAQVAPALFRRVQKR